MTILSRLPLYRRASSAIQVFRPAPVARLTSLRPPRDLGLANPVQTATACRRRFSTPSSTDPSERPSLWDRSAEAGGAELISPTFGPAAHDREQAGQIKDPCSRESDLLKPISPSEFPILRQFGMTTYGSVRVRAPIKCLRCQSLRPPVPSIRPCPDGPTAHRRDGEKRLAEQLLSRFATYSPKLIDHATKRAAVTAVFRMAGLRRRAAASDSSPDTTGEKWPRCWCLYVCV